MRKISKQNYYQIEKVPKIAKSYTIKMLRKENK